MILEDLHILLPDTDTSIDAMLTLLEKRAITFIKNYLNNNYNSGYIQANFEDAITELVYNAYVGKPKENIQSESQGSRSVTYKSTNFAITDSVKALLPLPSVRLMG